MGIAVLRKMVCVGVLAALFTSAHAEIFVCAVDSIRVFADNAASNDPPIRIIAGASTTLSGCFDVALDIKHDEIYVADGSIKIFPAGADGNVAPSRQIVDSSIFASSVAVDFQTDEVFVGSPGPTLLKFDRKASGETAPLLSKTVADTPIALFVNRFHNELAMSGYVGGNVYFLDASTFNPAAHSTLSIAMPRGLFGSSGDDELFVAVPGGVQVYAWNGPLHRTITSTSSDAWGIGITAGSALWTAFKGATDSVPDQLIAYLSTPGPTQVLAQINTAAPLTKQARGIAVSRAAGCGAGHVGCDSVFWESFEPRRD